MATAVLTPANAPVPEDVRPSDPTHPGQIMALLQQTRAQAQADAAYDPPVTRLDAFTNYCASASAAGRSATTAGSLLALVAAAGMGIWAALRYRARGTGTRRR
jgi:hypothetical protein